MKLQFDREDVINRVYDRGGHVVILGAGASIAAALRNPEKGGKRLPSMLNLVELVGLEDLVESVGASLRSDNFEQLYSNLHSDNSNSDVIHEIEARIHSYFAGMELPDTPTIYDYLVCSLRPKDLIATFNWDPFLYQAWCRNKHFERPHVSFLHGNVAIGYSKEDKRCGPAGMYFKQSGSYAEPTKLLYPVAQKNYKQDEFIAIEWDRLTAWLHDAQTKRVTVFGYSAPNTDVEAVSLLRTAWGTVDERNMEQFEFINTTPEEILLKQWEAFVHTHHYNCTNDFFSSSLAKFPRRTGENYFHHYLPESPAEAFSESNPVPTDFESLDALWTWFAPLVAAEKNVTKLNPNRN